MISIHEFPSFNIRSQISRSRGCHLFAVDSSKAAPKLCVAIKKKLVLFNWINGDFAEWKVSILSSFFFHIDKVDVFFEGIIYS